MPFTAKQPSILSRVVFAPGFWHSMPVSSKHTEQRLHLYSYKFDSGQECFNTPHTKKCYETLTELVTKNVKFVFYFNKYRGKSLTD